jgi:DICT domain-containing protein
VTTYGPRDYEDLRDLLAQFDVELTHRSLPIPESAGYLTVSDGESFLGAVSAGAFGELLDPPRESPWDPATRESAFRDLTSLLADTTFRATERRHLLATSREFEDRAYRMGRGALHVGFQRLSAFRTQLPVYERLARETDLSITVYGEREALRASETSGDAASCEGDRRETSEGVSGDAASLDLTLRTEGDGEIGEYWIVAFDGGGDEGMACALLAEETAPGEYEGAWTYDPALVNDLVAYLNSTYGEA